MLAQPLAGEVFVLLRDEVPLLLAQQFREEARWVLRRIARGVGCECGELLKSAFPGRRKPALDGFCMELLESSDAVQVLGNEVLEGRL